MLSLIFIRCPSEMGPEICVACTVDEISDCKPITNTETNLSLSNYNYISTSRLTSPSVISDFQIKEIQRTAQHSSVTSHLSLCHKETAKGKKCPQQGAFRPKAPSRGFGCLELVIYGIRELAQQHYEPLILLQSEIFALLCCPTTNHRRKNGVF